MFHRLNQIQHAYMWNQLSPYPRSNFCQFCQIGCSSNNSYLEEQNHNFFKNLRDFFESPLSFSSHSPLPVQSEYFPQYLSNLLLPLQLCWKYFHRAIGSALTCDHSLPTGSLPPLFLFLMSIKRTVAELIFLQHEQAVKEVWEAHSIGSQHLI